MTTWAPNQVAFHPANNGELAVFRYTAPLSGEYSLLGTVQGIDSGMGTKPLSDGVEFLIRRNPLAGPVELLLGSQFITEAFDPLDFTDTFVLLAGETVDFLLGPRSNYHWDGTGLSATFSYLGPLPAPTPVPEPASAAMAISALGFWAGLRRRSRRSAAKASSL